MLGNFEDVQKMSNTNMEATTKAFGTLSKTTQAIAAEMADILQAILRERHQGHGEAVRRQVAG